MIITSRKEVFYKIEVTASQADLLQRFLDNCQPRNIDNVCQMAKFPQQDRDEINEMFSDLRESLAGR